MNLICWNVRGLGNTRTFANLKFVLQRVKPSILFLCETKMLTIQMQSIRRKLGFDNCFVVDRNGLSGGLALLWMDDVDLNIVSYSRHHIDCNVIMQDGDSWRFTGFYGYPDSSQRVRSAMVVWG